MPAAKAVAILKGFHGISALAVLGLSMLIVFDVVSRAVFNSPFQGTAEIVKNSIVAITFMQLPLAIYSGAMLRTTIVYDLLPFRGQLVLRCITNLLGLTLFAVLVYASWEPAVLSWEIREYDGEGALHVPVYPVRFILVLMSAAAVLVHASLLLQDLLSWRQGRASDRHDRGAAQDALQDSGSA